VGTEESGLRDHIARNRAEWNRAATEYAGPGRHAWASEEPYWGVFQVPESEVGLLPHDLDGKDVVELGCGAGYVSAWLARRGARPVGIDLSEEQLASARTFQGEIGPRYPLVHGDAEQLPFADGLFDLAISEYGAALWCDPYRWIPEAARVLRPGGELILLTHSVFLAVCVPDLESEGPATERLRRPYFGMHRFEWPDDEGVEFHLGHGDLVRVLRDNGFEITDLIEIRPPEGSATRYQWASLVWARQWPCEEVWKARKAT
jgi:SAM-dependent methyltransferase